MDIPHEFHAASMAVSAENLLFYHGSGKSKKVILDDICVRVERGSIYGLLGPSGCGKTTLLRCIVGQYKPNAGVIKIYGRISGQKGFCIPGPGVGFMPQELALYPEISTEETLTFFGRVNQMPFPEISKRIAFLAELLEIPNVKRLIKDMSGGQQRRISFAAALIHKPPLLILDEPTVGVDPLLRKSIWKHLQNLATKDHLTIIVTTHYIEEARQAHTVGLMRNGRLLAETNPETLIKQHDVLTLEDVFLKLCIRDSKSREAAENHRSDLEVTVHSGDSKKPKGNPWVPRDVRQVYDTSVKYETDSSVSSLGAGEHVKVSLLNGNPYVGDSIEKDTGFRHQVQASSIRIAALVTKNLVRLKRNLPLLFFQMLVPTIQVIVFCVCVGGEPFDLPMAIVNKENGSSLMGEVFLEYIDPNVIIQRPYNDLDTALEAVTQGKAWGVLYIGPDFTDNMIDRFIQGSDASTETIDESTITLHLDLTNQQISITLYYKMVKAFQAFAESTLRQMFRNPKLADLPVIVGKPVYGTLKSNFTGFMAPGLISGITYIMAIALSGMSIILEKKQGLLDRSWASGVRYWEVIFSILFVLFLVLVFQVTLVLLFTFLAFNIECQGSLVWVIIATLLVGLEGMSYGLLISAICNEENMAIMITMGSFYPTILLSGIIWPVEAMPYYARYLSYCMPLTLITNTLRSVISRGWSITDNNIWDGYLSAIAWIIPIILLSSFIFKVKK